MTDLFLNDADRLNDEQIKVFDDALCLLIRRIESRALIELSMRLAPIDNSPIEAGGWRATSRSMSPGRCWPSLGGCPPAIWSRSPPP